MNKRRARRENAGRQHAGRQTALLSLMLTALASVASPAAAGSAKATFTVSAVVVPNCTTRGLTVVCTKGVTPPKTMSVRTFDGIGAFQESPSTSQTDQTSSTTVTVNF